MIAKQLGIDEEADVATIAKAMSKQNAFELEEALIEQGVTGAAVRSSEEWIGHPQGEGSDQQASG